jgi:hypothetical protein
MPAFLITGRTAGDISPEMSSEQRKMFPENAIWYYFLRKWTENKPIR